MKNKLIFENTKDAFLIVHNGKAVPIVIAPDVDQSVHIAVNTFADDIARVTGSRPDVLAKRETGGQPAIVVRISMTQDADTLAGQWEAFRIRMDANSQSLEVTGSDKVSPLWTVEAASNLTARSNLRVIHSV